MYNKCQKCGKQLSDPDSMRRGYGPECWENITGEPARKGKSIPAKTDPTEEEQIPGQMSLDDYLALASEQEACYGG
ncbi:MAG: DUF6011 domain-containing protein [Lachnospiraceae bacterium]|nr:DUF6011 domain-containing protein [Lachnospiraceae bacterium]